MTSREIIPLPAVANVEALGPHMAACTVGERNWVQAKLETGESNARCAELAGYSAANADTLKSRGYSLAHSERVQNALLEQSKRFLKTELPKSLRVMIEIRDSKLVKPETRLKAAVEVINRGGMSVVTEGHLLVEHKLSDAQMDARILQLASELGLDEATARRMLIAPADFNKNADAIDAEFEDVVDPMDPEKRAQLDHENEQRRMRDAMTSNQLAEHKAKTRAEKAAKAKAKYDAAQEYLAVIANADPDLADLL